MPSETHPALYERANFTADIRHDYFLKWIEPDFYSEETGHTEAPTGFVALLKVPIHLIVEYVTDEVGTHAWERMREIADFEPGWYIIRRDDNGLVWGMGYGGLCDEHKDFCTDTLSEEAARADFNEARDTYEAWDSQDD